MNLSIAKCRLRARASTRACRRTSRGSEFIDGFVVEIGQCLARPTGGTHRIHVHQKFVITLRASLGTGRVTGIMCRTLIGKSTNGGCRVVQPAGEGRRTTTVGIRSKVTTVRGVVGQRDRSKIEVAGGGMIHGNSCHRPGKALSVGKDLTVDIWSFVPTLRISYRHTTVGIGTGIGSDTIIGTPIFVKAFDESIIDPLPTHGEAHIHRKGGIRDGRGEGQGDDSGDSNNGHDDIDECWL